MSFVRVMSALSVYCHENNIAVESLSLILNFRNRDAGVRFDAALSRELDKTFVLLPIPDIRKFKMMGIDVLVESPAHVGWS
jgi:hypothetical protein